MRRLWYEVTVKKLNQEKVVIHYSYALCTMAAIDVNQVQCSQRKITLFQSPRSCKLYKNIIEVLEVEGSLEIGKQNKRLGHLT